MSSKNPDIDELAKNKSRIILLNKNDLAHKGRTEEWKNYVLGESFEIGENLTGIYYLHIKEIKDNAENVAEVNKDV